MCIAPSPTSPPSNNNKTVRFVEYVTVKEIKHLKDHTEEETSSIYFSQNDLKNIRRREKRLSKHVSKGSQILLDTSHETVIGVLSMECKMQRKKRVVDGVLSVLLEQELQYANFREEPLDHEYIAQIYSHTANESRVLAYHRALSNAAHVEVEVDLAKEVVNHVTAEFEAARPHPAHHKPFRWNTNTADSALVPVTHAISPSFSHKSASGLVSRKRGAINMDMVPTRSVE